MEDFTTMLALVDLVSAMSMDVRTEVVTTGIATPTDVTGKGLLPSVDPHVTTEVSGSYELAAAHLTGVWSVRLFLSLGCRVSTTQHVLLMTAAILNDVL